MKEAKPAFKDLFNFLLLAIFLFLSWFIGRYFKLDIDYLRNSLLKFPIFYSSLAFVLAYVIVSFFIWFAKDIFRVAGAVIFGAYLSTLLVYSAEMINAALLFNLSRFLGRDFVKSRLKGSLGVFDQRIDKSGFWGLFALRITPWVPFRFLDIAAGLTAISFKEYFLISALASPTRIFWLQFILAAVGLSAFRDYNFLAEYFLNNKIIFVFSLIYLIATIISGFFLKRSLLKKG